MAPRVRMALFCAWQETKGGIERENVLELANIRRRRQDARQQAPFFATNGEPAPSPRVDGKTVSEPQNPFITDRDLQLS